MATCRKCMHWEKCSKADGTTQFYGKEIACNNAEKLCEWFISTTEVAPIADTVRKMHSEIKERCIKGGIYPAFVGLTIDKVAYEMTRDGLYVVANGLLGEGETNGDK